MTFVRGRKFQNYMNRRRRAQAKLAEVRVALWSEQGGLCFYCDVPTTLPTESNPIPTTATVEHLTRKADGGTNDPDNLVMACSRCNSTRGKTDWRDWLNAKEAEAIANCRDPDAGYGGPLHVFAAATTQEFDPSLTWPWRASL